MYCSHSPIPVGGEKACLYNINHNILEISTVAKICQSTATEENIFTTLTAFFKNMLQ